MLNPKESNAIVQIGLFNSCEYSYLIDRKTVIPEDIPLNMPITEETQWHYYGVDMNLNSIEHCKKRYNKLKLDNPNRFQLIKALIGPEDNKNIENDGFTTSLGLVEYYKKDTELIETPAITLATLFSRIPMPVELLVMDIEGAELPVLEGYDWHQHPLYIIIESHYLKDIYPIASLLDEQGYYFMQIRKTMAQLQLGFVHRKYGYVRRSNRIRIEKQL